MSGAIDSMLHGKTEIDDEFYDELEEILVMGDVGCMTASEIVEKLRERVMKKHLRKPEAVKNEIKEIVAEMLEGGEEMSLITLPSVILVIGVNGVGKTTSIGKLAAMYKNEGKKVILAAADTFRAAAIEQLEEWADRAGVEIVKHREGADPAAVIYDTIQAGKARNADIIICDTAGRLHNKKNLMEELAKIYRVIDRELPYSDRESLLVLDATTGQNAVNQAKEFKNVAEITGIILTKLDGTAKGGVVLNIKNELGVPVKFIGVGEKVDDLRPFNARAFAEGLFDAEPIEDEEEKKEEVDPQEDERFKQIQAELEDMKAEKEEQKQVMEFANKAKEVDARFNNFCVGLSNALENEFKKFGIDLTKSIEEIAKENPAQAEMARNLIATAERIRTQEAMKAQEEIKNTYLNVVFHKAERLLKKYDVTETEAPLVADTFVQILRATGVNNLKEDLEQKVQLAVANAKYLISKNVPVVEEKPAVEEPKDVPPVDQVEELPVEPAEVEAKEPTKEEPEVDINEFKEGVQGDAGKATVSVDNVLEHMASLPFKERVQYYKDNFNLVTEAAKKRYNK